MAQNANGTPPASAATFPNESSGQPNAPVASSSANGTGDVNEGKVVISTKEYADLQRAKARSLSFDKRVALRRTTPSNGGSNGEGGDNGDAAVLARAEVAERRAMQLEVKDRTRDILAKPEYAKLPASTRELILRNPAMLSQAEDVEEAMLDIEDFVNDTVSKLESAGGGIPPVTVKTDGGSRPAPQNTETPPVNANGPAPAKGDEVEDVSKLSGAARSRAILRNSIRKSHGGAV